MNNPVLKAPKIIKSFRGDGVDVALSHHSKNCMYCRRKIKSVDQVVFKLTERGEWKTAHAGACPLIEG